MERFAQSSSFHSSATNALLLLVVLATLGISEENAKAVNWIHSFSVDDKDDDALVLPLEVP